MVVRPLSCPIFVGREEEFNALNDARKALGRSRGGIVLVSGEPGIGKSRLLEQFLGMLSRDTRPRYTASAECTAGTDSPFAPFRRIADALRDAVDPAELPLTSRAMLAQFAPRAGDETTVTTAPLERGDVAAGFTAFIGALVKRRATVLVVEDLHWADQSSLELLQHLASRLARTRALLIATHRPAEFADPAFASALATLQRDRGVTRIALEPFAETQMRDLIAATAAERSSERALTGEAFSAVMRRSEGNPFYAEELLKDALEGGQERRGLPLSIRASIGERLATFPADERVVIESAAVFGVAFEPETLAKTLGASVDEILPALRRARNCNLIVEDGSDAVRYRFRHALTRDAVYDDLLLFDVRRTHARLLAILEALPDADRHLEALAHHASGAGDRQKTFEYSERAGDAALALYALHEARAAFERAYEHAPDLDEGTRLLARLGSVAEMQGDITIAIGYFERAEKFARERDDYDTACDMTRRIATNRNNLGDRNALSHGMKFLQTFGERVSPGRRDMLLALLGRLAMIIFELDTARELLGQISDYDGLPLRARQNAHTVHLEIAFAEGDRNTYLEHAPALLQTIYSEADPFNSVIAAYALAPIACWFDDRATNVRALARATELEARWTFSSLRTFGLSVRTESAYQYGELAIARECITAARRDNEAKVTDQALAIVSPLVATALGEPALVHSSEHAVFERTLAEGNVADDAMIVAAGALYRLANGREREGRAALRAIIPWMSRPAPWFATPVIACATYLEKAELEPLRALLDMPIPDDDRAAQAYRTLAYAIFARREGDDDTAEALARKSAAAFRALQWPLFEARALEVAGDIEGAKALYRACGALGPLRALSESGEEPGEPDPFASLTVRERATAAAIARGATNADIAQSLGVSVKTIEKHVTSLFAKLGVKRRTQIVAIVTRDQK